MYLVQNKSVIILLLLGICWSLNAGAQLEDDETIRWYIESMQVKQSEIAENFYCDSTLTDIYLENRCSSFWTERSKIVALLRVILEAEEAHGLYASDYHYDQILSFLNQWGQLSAESAGQLELLATDALLLLTSHLMNGKVNPVSIDPEWYIVRAGADVRSVTARFLEQEDLEGYFDRVIPQYQEYALLSKEFAALKLMEQKGGWSNFSEQTAIEAGQRDTRIPDLKDRLILEGYLESAACNDDAVLDSTVLSVIPRFRKRFGLSNDNKVDGSLLSALNISVSDRLNQIRVNMERWRWLPAEQEDYLIKVNIASFQLEVVRNDSVIARHKIISGKPTRKTPIFSSKMTYLVINPTWTVPPGILKADVLPAQRKNSGYLSGKNISVIDRSGKVLDPKSVNWSSKEVYGYTYRQAPGKSNALGQVKFMFDNSFNIYIHDTPSRELFANEERALSSGCIRADKPLDLAKLLLEHKGDYPMERIQEIVRSGKTTTVFLNDQPAVYLLYWTAWIDADGLFEFRKDVYERDEPLIEALSERHQAS